MTKRKLNIARLILAVVLVVSLASAVGLVAFAEDAEATAQTREFNATFDRMLDDGSGEGAVPAYRAIEWTAGQCATVTDPIFKADMSKGSQSFSTISLVMRSPDGSVSLSDLSIAFRISGLDADDKVLAREMTSEELSDVDAITVSEGTDIGAEWKTVTIDLTQVDFVLSEAEKAIFETTLTVGEGNATNVNTDGGDLTGLHIFATDNTKAGKLDVQKLYVTKGNTDTVIWDLSKGINNSWWVGGQENTFADVANTYEITTNKQIANTEGNLDEAYGAIVLRVKGTGNVTVAPIGEDGTVGTAKAWTALTDLEGTAVAAIGENYVNHVISLTSLGAKKIKGVQIAVEGGKVSLTQAFFTNMESRDPDKYFPVLDADSVAYMTQFDFEYLNADANYDASVEKCAEYNLWYILCYNDNPSAITNGHLVLDANGKDYTQMKVRSKVISEGRRYLVIKYKLQNGATLTNFRFDVLKSDPDTTVDKPVYANNLKAAFGLSSLSDLNPYKATSGYQFMVVDLLETFGVTDIAGLDLYFSGEGQMLIDEVFYVHPQVVKAVVAEDNLLEEALEINVNDAGEDVPAYQYIAGMNLDGKYHDGIQIVMRGEDADTTLDEIRIELGGKVLYFNKNTSLALDIYGREMPALTAENQVYAIDFVQSGVTGAMKNINIHATTVKGGKKIIVESFKFIDYDLGELKQGDEILANPIVATSEAEGYKYVGGFDVPNLDDKQFAVMEMEVEGDISELRLEMGGGTYWVKENELSLKDSDGQLFDATITTKRTLVIDLKQTGVTGEITNVNIHNTFAAGATVTVSSVKFKGYTDMVVSDELLSEPIINAQGGDYYYAGYLPVASDYVPQKLVLKVTGDLTNVRLGFEGTDKTLWFAENAQGSLYGVDGKLFDLTEKGERTIVIDLEKSGLYYPLNGVHVHNGTNALTISSAVYYSMPLGSENVTFAINDDTKPVISQSIATTGKVGTEIALSATATDNYDENVAITFEVTVNGAAVTLTNNKFTPATAGTYAVKVIATDEAGNVATETVSITVTAEQSNNNGGGTTSNEPANEPDGLGTGAIVGIVLACVAVVAAGAVAFIFIRKKKMGK